MILTHLKQIFNINSLNTTSKYFIWYYNLISKRLNNKHFELIKRSRKIASKSIVRVKFKEKYTEQELKQKFGRLGAQNGMFNKTHSTEAKNSISKKNKGPNYKLKGKLLTEEHKNNIKKSKQNISEETKIKMKISAKKRGANNKIKYKILVIDKNTNQELLCCLYIPDCRILLNTIFNKNVKDGDIRACLCQTQKSAKGFIFKDLTNP